MPLLYPRPLAIRFVRLSLANAFILSSLILSAPANAVSGENRGCMGRLSTESQCSGVPSVSIAPFRKANQSRYRGSPKQGAIKSKGSANIVSQSFQKISDNSGEWSGIVEGDGLVHLALQISEGGRVLTTKYIGNVTLSKHTSSFHFRSALPRTANWRWKILASVHPPAAS